MEDQIRDEKNKSTAMFGKGMDNASTAAASITATTALGKDNRLQSRTNSVKTKPQGLKKGKTSNASQFNGGTSNHEERSQGRDPYSNTKFSYNAKSKKDKKDDVASLKSYKANLEDSIGVIGSSLSKMQVVTKKSDQRTNKFSKNTKSIRQEKSKISITNNHTANKSPDIVGNRQLLINQQTSKERFEKQSNGHNNYSATKSQANLTNNNFAKFSSSGYTNNAFLLMSGHHDFTQNDFHNQI